MSEQENEITALLQQILSRTENMEIRLLNIEDRLDAFEEKQTSTTPDYLFLRERMNSTQMRKPLPAMKRRKKIITIPYLILKLFQVIRITKEKVLL